jgi:hypothetical protein
VLVRVCSRLWEGEGLRYDLFFPPLHPLSSSALRSLCPPFASVHSALPLSPSLSSTPTTVLKIGHSTGAVTAQGEMEEGGLPALVAPSCPRVLARAIEKTLYGWICPGFSPVLALGALTSGPDVKSDAIDLIGRNLCIVIIIQQGNNLFIYK